MKTLLPNPDPWIVIDANNMVWRNFHAIPSKLKYNGEPTGALFGFFRDILALHRFYGTEQMAFCFDRGVSKRKTLDATYKSNRKEPENEEVKLATRKLQKQLVELCDEVLPSMGYRNVFKSDGYEADDLIASICKHALPEMDDGATIIISSTDQDLYQLLQSAKYNEKGQTVKIHLPGNTIITSLSFKEKYGISPKSWHKVKAIAGCSSDNVAGIKGVGEKTAIKYIRFELKKKAKAYQSIVNNPDVVEHNLQLVTLPLPGTPKLTLVPNETTNKKWNEVMDIYGFGSNLMRQRKQGE